MPEISSEPNPAPALRAEHPTRRDFAKTLAAVAATPLLAGVAGCAPSVPTTAAPEPVRPVAEPADPVAAALAEVIRLRYGTRLSVQEMERVRRGIEGNLQAARALRAFELPIATEPAFVFRPYRGGGE